jgi:hypothetical protein
LLPTTMASLNLVMFAPILVMIGYRG